MVKKTCYVECSMSDPLERWKFKIRLLRKKLKGWHRNRDIEIKEKAKVISELDLFHKLAEQQHLT
jgi:hypothetical protein